VPALWAGGRARGDHCERDSGDADCESRRAERQGSAAGGVEQRIGDRGDRPTERYGGLAHAERPASPRRRVGGEQRSGTRHRHGGRADAEHEQRREQHTFGIGEHRAGESEHRDRRPRRHGDARTRTVDRDARSDERETRAQQAGCEHGSQLEQAEAVVLRQLGPDRRQSEVDQRDGGLRGGGERQHGSRPADRARLSSCRQSRSGTA
jgi:hypothetical protein